MNKLAPGTEGTMTLVGSLDTIKKPLVGLIRLAHGTVMPNLMEVQIPVRFIFVLFTPAGSVSMDCHEIGRAFSTLMSNKVNRSGSIKPTRIPGLKWAPQVYHFQSSLPLVFSL